MMQTRRGVCPSLTVPMPTGDGLLARLMPAAPIPPAAMAAFCAAARTHGNGIVEITARGSLQVRGLTADSAPRFAADVAALGIAMPEGVPVIAPFGGGGADLVATQLRRAIAAAQFALSPKVSIVVDGGGALNLDALSADVRLRVIGGDAASPSLPREFHLGLGCPRRHGAASAALPLRHRTASIGQSELATATTWLGTVALEDAVGAVTAILTMIAAQGPTARVADVVAREGAAAFLAVAAVKPAPAPPPRVAADFIGLHPTGEDRAALGIALVLGHTDAESLAALLAVAAQRGARAVWPAPTHALLLTGLSTLSAARDLIIAAEHQGFIVRPDDPRRRIAACPGAPACGSGLIAARTLAAGLVPLLAPIAGQGRDGSVVVHVSGCPKGCAHPGPAALTLVGAPQGCAVVYNGCAGDAPHHDVDAAHLGDEARRLASAFLAPGSTESAHGRALPA
jgi:precorrin-3B synthase